MITLLKKVEGGLEWIGSNLKSVLLLALRLYWGYSFFQTGMGKFHNFDRTVKFFTSLHIPLPTLNVYMAAGTEMIGGILLFVGLFSRWISIPLMFCMGVAYATAERDALHALFSDPDKFVSADPFLFLLTPVIVFTFGAGFFSLDRLFFGKNAAGSVK
jgi:putative oxidoreductase